jgi:hypothetical protein
VTDTKHIGIAEKLAADFPVKRTSPNAAPVYVIQSFMLTALTDGRRFSHVERLRARRSGHFGMVSVVGDGTVRRFFKSVDPVLGAEWIARNIKPMGGALSDRIIMDWDSTVQPKIRAPRGNRDRLQSRQARPPFVSSAFGRDRRHSFVPGISLPVQRQQSYFDTVLTSDCRSTASARATR